MSYKEDIRGFIVDNFLFGDGAHLNDNDSLLENGIIDSTGILELIFFLENTYQISIQTEELTPDNMDSVTRVANFLDRKLPAAGQDYLPADQNLA